MLVIAQRVLDPAQLVDKARVPKCCRSVIRGHGKQLLINLVGKIGAITRRSNETAFAVDTDRNYDPAARLFDPAHLGHDFLLRNVTGHSEALLQPFRKCLPSVPPHHLDGLARRGIAQTHKGEIQLQRSDQHIGEVGGNGGWFSSHPRLRDGRKREEIPDRCTQAEDLSSVIYGHLISSLSCDLAS